MSVVPGISYAPEYDTLIMRFYDVEADPVPLRPSKFTVAELGLTLLLLIGEADGNLFSITVGEAGKHIPGAFRENTDSTELLIQRVDDSDRWFIPLIPRGRSVCRIQLVIDPPSAPEGFELGLTNANKLVGFIMRDAPSRLGRGDITE